jgi:hypothetical protein
MNHGSILGFLKKKIRGHKSRATVPLKRIFSSEKRELKVFIRFEVKYFEAN